jgi:hypothetical protein
MKVLLHTFPLTDYYSDTLFDGLCRLLGAENVDDYPTKDSLHTIANMHYYPSSFDYPVNHTDEEKLKLLSKGYYDLIIAAVRPIKAIRNSGRRHLLIESIEDLDNIVKLNTHQKPIVLVDGCDLPDIEQLAIDKTHPLLYFKREYSPKISYPDFVKPSSLCISDKHVPKDISGRRINSVFWSGKGYDTRLPFLEKLQTKIEVCNRYIPFWKYTRLLKEHAIGLSLFGFGEDTIRYYETPAQGTLLFSQKPTIKIENDFVDGETAVFFETPEEMMKKLDYCLSHPEYTDKIRLAGREHFLRYHTSTQRAEQLINHINPKPMKLSIVIAFYNSHRAVQRQVQYFSKMNLPDDIEFIFVDDGSNPPHLQSDYSLKNLKIIHTNDKRPWTQGIARNLGSEVANGEYLMMTDIDHILSKEAIMDSYNFKGDKMIFPRYFGVLLKDGTLSLDHDVLVDYGLDPARLKTRRGTFASYHGNTFTIKKSTFNLLGMYDPKHCLYGHHAANTKGEDSVLNRRWNHYAADNGIKLAVGSPIYIFPIGRYHINGESNPFHLFHSLSQELAPQPPKE